MKLSIKYGFLLAFITIIIYYIFYCIYKKDINYFLGYVFINSFVMTFLYASYALLLIYYINKKYFYLTSYNYFIISFITLSFSGTLSLIIIFLFFNYFDYKSLLMLKKGIIENCFNKYKYDIIKEYGYSLYKERLFAINNGNIFNYWIFLIYLFFCILYYFTISLLIFLFFRQRNVNYNIITNKNFIKK